MIFENENIKEVNANLLKLIESNCNKAKLTKKQIEKLKQESIKKVTTEEKKVEVIKQEDFLEENIYDDDLDNDFEEEINYYLEDYNNLEKGFTLEKLETILPSKKKGNYRDICRRLQAESFKNIKFFSEFKLDDLSSTDLIELKEDIELEKVKIRAINEVINNKEEVVTNSSADKNKIVLVPSITGNIRVLDEFGKIPFEYYSSFLDLIKSIEDGTFKNIKRFNGNKELTGVLQVKDFKIRIVFARLSEDTYGLITAFVKKSDKDRGYQETLKARVNEYQKQEEFLKRIILDAEFMKENELYLEELYRLLNKEKNKGDVLSV